MPSPPAPEAYVYWGKHQLPESQLGHDRPRQPGRLRRDERFITGVGAPAGVAVNSPHIYWIRNETGTIGRARLDGTGATPNFIADARAPEQPGGLAVDEEHIYWVSRSNTSEFDAGIGAIGRADVDGTDVDQNFITGLDYPNGPVAVAGSHLYWTIARISEALYDTTDGIARANTDGTGVEESFLGSGRVMGMAVDDAHIWQTAKVTYTP